MFRKNFRLVLGCACLSYVLSYCRVWAFENPKAFAFVNQSYVITAEMNDENSFIVNFVNLSDFVLVVQPGDFIYRSASGNRYIGQVYELEHMDSKGGMQKYSASILLQDHSFKGLNIVGLFREQDRIEELSIRIGGKRFYLQPLEKNQFEEVLRKIEELDLNSDNIPQMFQELFIKEMGTVKSTDGSDEWDRDWEGLITDGINPPRAIKNPPIPLPEDTEESKRDKTVRVSCRVTKNGGILDLKVVKGIDRKLDQIALDGVANSWVFLPATKNGEVFESLYEFNVGFAH